MIPLITAAIFVGAAATTSVVILNQNQGNNSGGFSLKASYQLSRRVAGHVSAAKQALAEARAQDAMAVGERLMAFSTFDSGKPADGETATGWT